MTTKTPPARVLIIAGSDPSGGAGIQADIKTVTALGGYAMTAITALTVQDTKGVTDVQAITPEFIEKQIRACIEDIGVDAIKIGMIPDKDTAYMISGLLYEIALDIPTVLDPVMVATSGDSLASDGVAVVLYREMLKRSNILTTPNAPELSAFTGLDIHSTDDLLKAGRKLSEWAAGPLLLKGGHIKGDEVVDIFLDGAKQITYSNPYIATTSTHGTGCTLASAIATGLAQGRSHSKAIERAIAYVRKAIETAPGFGHGHGPLNHAHTVSRFKFGDDDGL